MHRIGNNKGWGRTGRGGQVDMGTRNEERTASKRVSHRDCAAVDVNFLVWNADCVN